MVIAASLVRRTEIAVLLLAALAILLIAPGAVSAEETGSTESPVWSADMLVVEYTSIAIGAASPALFSNIGGSADLQIKSLWSYIPDRDLRLSFEDGVPDAADYTLQVGDLTLEFPEESSGNSSFKWTDVDVDWEDGQTISVRIVQTSALEAPAANTPATGEPTISGTAQVDEALTAETSSIADDDGLTNVSYSYQWTRSNGSTYTDIAGETDSAYTLVFADQGKTLKVKVSFTDDADNDETLTSEPTEEVTAAPNRAATGDPAISGTPQVDQTLTASTSAIADQDGLDGVSYNYQWTADDTDIQDATDSTYTPSVSDVGNTIKVKVSFTDDRNNAEARTSLATTAVLATVPTQPLSLTVATGDEIQELDASWQAPSSNGGSSITGYKVQWKKSADRWDTEADVSQATVTGTTHTIPELTGGVEYAVRVIASNTAGDGPASDEVTGTPARGTSQQQTGDSTSPTVSSIAITSDPGSDEVYAIGDAIQITVTFSADVTVAGKPQLELDIGGNAKPAEYQSTNASSTVFSYTVAEGDSDTDGIAVAENKLTLNGGTIKDASDNAADLDHVALEAQPGHKVDGVRPTISGVRPNIDFTKVRMSGTRANVGDLINVSVDFTEEIFLDGSPHITLDIDSASRVASLIQIGLYCPALEASTSDPVLAVNIPEGEEPPPGVTSYCFWSDTHGITMLFHHTVAKGDLDTDGVGIPANSLSLNGGTLRDAAGNDAVITHEAVADNPSVLIDGVPPEITSIEITSDPGEDDTYAEGDTIKFNVTFSEDLEFGLGWTRLRLDIGGKTRMAYQVRRDILDIRSDETGYIMAYSYTVADGDNDEDGISFPANALHKLKAQVLGADGNRPIFENEAIAYNAEHKVATATTAEDDTDDTQKTGFLMISGTLNVGETVNADFSNVDDEDGVEYAVDTAYFDWSREGGGGGLLSRFDTRYIIAASDEGKRLKVSTSFFDDNGNKEHLFSPWTEPVGSRAPSNSAPTGLPTITGTPQVDQTLTADTSAIDDGDGLEGVSYSYQWIRSDNGADTDIAGETDSTYTLVAADVGKTIKVKVSFTDDADNDETLTSEATEVVAATVPTAAMGLTVARGDQIQELDASWQVPSSNGGSAVTGYKLQWKEAADSWDTEADVSEATVTGTTHTITDLTGGVEYAVRVIASNTAGDGPASDEVTGTPARGTSQQQTGDSTSPTVSSIAITSDPGSDEVYAIGDAIQITVTFSADVTVAGKPQLELDIGGNAKPAEYQSTNASSTVFSYTVAEGDSDTDGIAVAENKLTLNGGTIKDASDNAADLDHVALEAQPGHKVDGVRPTISGVRPNIDFTKVRMSGTRANVGDLINVSVDFTEEIFLDGSPHITLDIDSASRVASLIQIGLYCPALEASTSDPVLAVNIPEGEEPPPGVTSYCFWSDTHGITMLFHHTVAKGELDTDGVGIPANSLSLNGGTLRDAAGNDAVITHEAVADNPSVLIDGVPPEITSIEITSDPGEDDTYAEGDTIKFNVTFSEDLEFFGFGWTRLRLDIGGKTRMAYQVRREILDIRSDETGYIMAYSYTVAAGDNDEDGISFPANALHKIWLTVLGTDGNHAIFENEAIAYNAEHKVATATTAEDDTDDTQKTGFLMISGTLNVGETVNADFSNVDDEDGVEYAVDTAYFDWSREGGGGGLHSRFDTRYIIAASDEGKRLNVSTWFFDDNGNEEYLTSPWTEPVGPRAPSNSAPTGLPTITGTPQVDQTLTANTSSINDGDGLEGVSYSYQWIRSDNGTDTDIAGKTDSTYTLVAADVGKTIKVKVSFTDDADNDETLTSEATVAVAATVPSAPQSMTLTSGSQTQELDVSWQAPSSNGGSAVTGYKVQWKESTDSWDTADDVSEATETGTTHTISGLTGGVEYAVRVMASNDVGDGPASTEVKGTPAGGVSEQTVEPENSAPTGLPSISGTPQVDQTLTADTSNIDDEDGLANVSYRYQWGAGGSDIDGATGSTYTLTYSEQGQTIQVQVSFTDDADNEETLTSAATVAVAAAPNRGATGQPTISGTPQVGETLTADTANIADEDGLTNPTFAYQWRGGGLTIIGATGSTYTLTASDQGKTITVRVRFIDDRNSIESRISNATTAVAAVPNRQATGQPTISGTPQVGQTLTADTSAIDDEDGLTNVSYGYQWIAGGSDIEGATGSSYELTNSEQGQTIQVRVTFTDDRDNAETLTSIATAEVAAAPVPLTVRLKVAAPATHDGSSEFTFEIEFSEEFGLSYKTLRDFAFTETGGEVRKAQRTDKPSNIPWRITVKPQGTGDVTIVLPVTTNCGAQGAICTGDGRKLSNSLNFAVSGPGQ